MRVVFFHVILRCRAPRAHGRFLEKGMRTTTEDLKLANLQKLVKDVEQLLSGVAIQEPPKPAPRDGGYKIRVDANRMTAWLELYPAVSEGIPVDLSEVLLALEREGLPVDPVLVERLVERCNNGETIVEGVAVVLRGTPPAHPSPASIRFLCAMERTRSFETDTDQTVDWKNMWSIPIVAQGNPVAIVTLPVPGTDGVDVFGAPVPAAPAKDLGIVYGPNVEATPEEGAERVVSRIDGQPVFDGRHLDVVAVLNVKGDVGMHTGDIDFPGAVVIERSVQQGFRVKAGGDVQVGGGVFNARIFCGGVCRVKGGVIGDQSVIRADKGATVGFVEYGSIVSTGRIDVLGYALFSTLKSRDTVFVLGKNQRGVIGGLVMARNLVELFSAGSILEPVTQIQAGSDPFIEEWLKDIAVKRTETEGLKQRVELALASLKTRTHGFQPDIMTAEDRKTVLALAEHHKKLAQTLSELQAAGDELHKRTSKAEGGASARIRVRDKIFPNVTLNISGQSLVILKPERFVSFAVDREGHILREAFR